LILTGDWNMDLDEVQRETVSWPTPIQALANQGAQPTRRRSDRAIDHIAYRGTPATPGPIPAPRVLDDWDLSDHFPVLARFPSLVARRAPAPVAPPTTGHTRIFVKRPEIREHIVTSNRWHILATELEDDFAATPDDPTATLERTSSRWTESCHSVATTLELHAGVNPKKTTVSRSLSRAVLRRRQTFRQYRRALRTPENDVLVTNARTIYRDAKQRSKAMIQKQQAKAWHRQIRLAHAQMLHRPREFWMFSSRHGKWRTKGAPAGIQPIYSSDGTLLTDQPAIVARWAEHYEVLGTDVTGHSQDPDHWRDFDPPESRQPPMADLDAAFTHEDIWEALTSMKRHKAPGKDGIPTDFLQACLKERPIDFPPPPTPMTDNICRILNYAFEHGEIPPAWEESVVLSLPKDGDLADCANYRGISLMSTTLKILTVILAGRISKAGEDRDLFSPTQAGFRKLEECVTQAACIIDILQRRRIAGQLTFATFVDLRKAYDMVPHEALFAKLSRFGVSGRCLTFLRRLYAKSKITVRVGSGATAAYSTAFLLQRGLRQG
jgi:hypothetical protein